MRTRLLLFISLCLLIITTATAQNDESPEYSLRVPTAEDYLEAIPEIMDQWFIDAINIKGNPSIIETIDLEIIHRYPQLENVDLNLLNQTYETLAYIYVFENRDWWNKNAVLAWLRENDIDLDSQDEFSFEGVTISVERQDFNADGTLEWILHVSRESDYYQNYLVLMREGEAYQFIDTPLPWTGGTYHYANTRSGFAESQRFQDLNNDGLLDWIVAFGGLGGGHMNHGGLYILQWQDGEFVDLSPQYNSIDSNYSTMRYESPAGGGAPLFPYGVSISYEDVDNNGTTEVIINQQQDDNWGCVWTETRIFMWDGALYSLYSDERTYEEVQGCEIRRAEEAMWEGDYLTAIDHYERALTLPITDEYFLSDGDELTQYVLGRLTLAYSMTGQFTPQATLIERLESEEPLTEIIDVFYEALLTNINSTPLEICTDVYNVFVEFETCPITSGYCYFSDVSGLTIGRILENYGPPRSWLGPPEAINAGCNAPEMIETILGNITYTESQTPVGQLEMAGLSISDSLMFDINNDNRQDWLVWLDVRLDPILFVASDNTFIVSRPLFERPNVFTELSIQTLPDDVGIALFRIEFDDETPINERWEFISGMQLANCVLRNGEELSMLTGSIQVWRFLDDRLQRTQTFPLCEPLTLGEIFPNDTSELFAWESLEIESDLDFPVYSFVPTTLSWDSTLGLYISPNATEIEPTLTPNPPQPPDELFVSLFDAKALFEDGNYTDTLDILDILLSRYTSDTSLLIKNEVYFLRALTLEFQNRPDEALAEYITIYESAPESAWGRLARLHLEVVE